MKPVLRLSVRDGVLETDHPPRKPGQLGYFEVKVVQIEGAEGVVNHKLSITFPLMYFRGRVRVGFFDPETMTDPPGWYIFLLKDHYRRGREKYVGEPCTKNVLKLFIEHHDGNPRVILLPLLIKTTARSEEMRASFQLTIESVPEREIL